MKPEIERAIAHIRKTIDIVCVCGEHPTITAAFDAIRAHIETQEAEVERLYTDLIAETKSHAETAGFLQERKDQLARIREILSMLGDGEPVELAKRAAKVIGKFAGESRCDHAICPDVAIDCTDCAIRAALDATKEESDA
jgi:hypothetical protein